MYSTSQFNFTKANKTLTSEASNLPDFKPTDTIQIKSVHTGKVVTFSFYKIVEDKIEGEVLWVEYKPINPQVNLEKVIIFND